MNSPPPSRPEAWALLRAAGPDSWVLRHVACVERIAVAMARAAKTQGHDVDEALVTAGAVLHDIGRATTQDPDHAHLGAMMLREHGMADAVVRIVERHTGAGLTAADAVALGMPPNDLIPETLEEKIVCHADNLYSGDKRLTLDQIKAKYQAKGLPKAFTRIEALHAEMTKACGVDLETLEPVDLPGA